MYQQESCWGSHAVLRAAGNPGLEGTLEYSPQSSEFDQIPHEKG